MPRKDAWLMNKYMTYFSFMSTGGSVEAKMGASRSAFGKIRLNPSKQAQGPEKPQVCRTINPPIWL